MMFIINELNGMNLGPNVESVKFIYRYLELFGPVTYVKLGDFRSISLMECKDLTKKKYAGF